MIVEDPSKPSAEAFARASGPRAFAIVCFASLFAALAAMWFSPSLPSPLATQLGLAVGAAFGLGAAWQARDGGYMSPANPKLSRSERGFMMRHAWLRVPLMGAFVFGVAFAAVAYGLGGLVTAAVGRPASRTVTITGVGGGHKSCRHFEVREAGLLLDSALCAPDALLAQAEPGRTLLLQGLGSPFGLNVERMTLGPPVDAARP